jgi:hypothetical protein
VQQEDLSSETLEDSATSEAASNRSSYNGDEDPGPSGAGGGVGETTHNPSGYPPYFQSPGAHDNTSSDRWFNLPQGSNQFSSFQLKRGRLSPIFVQACFKNLLSSTRTPRPARASKWWQIHTA